MTWLYPSFLWALFALAIPIIIHLFNFRRYKKIIFPNVRFLEQIEQETKTGNQLKKYLILASRLLALLFLVFAFAQPILVEKNQSLKGGKKHISILIDNSYSMNLQGNEGQLLEAAKNRARAIVNNARNGDEFNIITADMDPALLHFSSKQSCLDHIDQIKITKQAQALQSLLQLQNSLLLKYSGEKLAYCISDFQKQNAVLSGNPLDPIIQNTWIKIPSELTQNISIDSAYLLSPILQAQQPITLKAQVHNYTDKAVENNNIELWIDGKPKGLASLNIPAFQAQTVDITFSLETGGQHACELRIPGDQIPLDDVLYFSLRLNQNHVVEQISANNNPYIDAVFGDNPGYQYTKKEAGNVNYSGFKQNDLLVFQGLENMGSGLISELKQFLQNGGTALIFPSHIAAFGGMNELAQNFNFQVPAAAVEGKIRVSQIDLGHPLFQNIFDQKNKNIDLPTVAKYYPIQSPSANVFMRLANGDAFLQDISVGKGHLILSAVALQNEFSNFQNHALFVPICLRASMMGTYKNPLYYLCSDLNDIATGLGAKQEASVVLKGEKTNYIPEVINREGLMMLNTNGEISEAGHYLLKQKDIDSSLANLAFNTARTESDTRSLSDSEFEQICDNFKIKHFEGSAEKLGAEINKLEKGVSLWKWCILFSLICLLFEILLIRFFRNNVKLSA